MKKKSWKSFAGVGGVLLIGGVSVSYIANANDVAILDFETLRNAVMKKVEGKTSSTPIVNASSTATKGTSFSLEDLTALRASSVEHSQKNNLQNIVYVEQAQSIQVADHASSSYNGMTNSTGGHSSNQVVPQDQNNKPSQSSSSVTPFRSSLPSISSNQPITKSNNNEPKVTSDSDNKKPSANNKPTEAATPKPDVLIDATPNVNGDNKKCVEEKSNQTDTNNGGSIICETKQTEKEIVTGIGQPNALPDLNGGNGFGNSPQPAPVTEPKIILTENQSSGSLDSGVKTDIEKSADLDSLIKCDADFSKCGLVSSDAENPATGLFPVNFENDLSVTGVPLPSSLWLASLGAAYFLVRRRQTIYTVNG